MITVRGVATARPESWLVGLHQPQQLKVIRLREQEHGADEVHGEPGRQQPSTLLSAPFVDNDPVQQIRRTGLGHDPQPQSLQPRYQHIDSTGWPLQSNGIGSHDLGVVLLAPEASTDR
jgi:hypothetical protein